VNEYLAWLAVTVTWAGVIWAVYRDQVRYTLPAGLLAGVALHYWATSTWFVIGFALTAVPAGVAARWICRKDSAPEAVAV
jgi:hypothetical protein